MAEAALKLGAQPGTTFMDKVKDLLPEQGHLNLCLTCSACSSGCPATGLEGMDPRKFLRMAALGMDEEVTTTPWVWMCTQCRRCVYACPMSIDIPQLVYQARKTWPAEKKPKGIMGSCEHAIRTEGSSAMGASTEDFRFVVEDVLEEIREADPRFKDMQVPIDKKNTEFVLNQNSREPVTEPDEMVPLWKILHLVGADWSYSTLGWGAENYCMFAAEDDSWEHIVRNKVKGMDNLGARTWLNTE